MQYDARTSNRTRQIPAREMCDLFASLFALSRAHNWVRAVSALEDALRFNLHVNDKSLGIAIAACDRASLWQHAIAFLSCARVPNLILWNATISACSRARRWAQASALLGNASDSKLRLDAISFNSAMRAFDGTGSSTSQWQAGGLLYEQMRKTRIYPNARSISAVTRLCAQGNAWHAALAFLNDARKASISMDTACYSSVLIACARSRRWQRSLQIFWESVETSNVSPDVASFNAAISACERGGDWKGALHLLWKMRSCALQADRVTFNAVMSACEKGFEWRLALRLLHSQAAQGPWHVVAPLPLVLRSCKHILFA